MKNIEMLCPSLSNLVPNTYRLSPSLYINGEAIVSMEGTTQGPSPGQEYVRHCDPAPDPGTGESI